MITVTDGKDTRTIDAERLRTVAQYSNIYIGKGGKVGCTIQFITNQIALGKIDFIEIAGTRFIVLTDEELERVEKEK